MLIVVYGGSSSGSVFHFQKSCLLIVDYAWRVRLFMPFICIEVAFPVSDIHSL